VLLYQPVTYPSMATSTECIIREDPKFSRYVVHTKFIPDPVQLFRAISQQLYANGGSFEIEVSAPKRFYNHY
jgi:hypothetical protein